MEIAEKCIERKEIDLAHLNAVEDYKKHKDAKRNLLNNNMNELKRQIEDTQKKKKAEKIERFGEPFEASVDGCYESPWSEHKKSDQLTQRRLLKETLEKQIEEKKRERTRQKQLEIQEIASSFAIGGGFKNPYIDHSTPITKTIEEQLRYKQLEKENQLKVIYS